MPKQNTPLRDSQLHGRSRLAGLQQYGQQVGFEMAEAGERFDRLKGDAAKPQVFSSWNLFPTPPDLADRVVSLAEIEPGMHVLEPSAGTGALVEAVRRSVHDVLVICVEIDRQMADYLTAIKVHTTCADVLHWNAEHSRKFQRIVMNPPFAPNAADVRHILHAREMLATGGRLVSICMNGPRQRKRLQSIASQWIPLPSGSFRSQATNVETAIVVIDA